MACDLHASASSTDTVVSMPAHVTTAESSIGTPVAVYFNTDAIGQSFAIEQPKKPTWEARDSNRVTTGATVPVVADVHSEATPSPATLSGGETAVIVAPDNVGTAAEARRRLYLSVAVTYLAALSFGLSIAYSSPALPGIRKAMEFSDRDSGLFGSLVTLGAVIGGISGGRQLSRIGRRGTLITSSLWHMGGWACLAVATPKAALFVGRLLTGVGTGTVALAVTVFISEISPAELRGLLNTGANLVLCSGILLVFVLGKFFSFWMLAVCCMLPAAAMSVSLLWCHESPLWLLKNGWRDRAAGGPAFLCGSLRRDRTGRHGAGRRSTWRGRRGEFHARDLTSPHVYRSILCVLLAMSMQQLSAVGVIITFAQDIFEEAGTSVSAENAAIAVAAIQVAMVAVATLLADRLGRKVLLLFSSAASSVSLAVLGLSFHIKAAVGDKFVEAFGWLPLTSLCTFFVGYSIGLGPLPWVLLGEMIPLKAKGFATGACTAILFAEGFILTISYNSIRAILGTAATYWMFSASLAVSFVLVFFFVPETKGKNLEQIERLFGRTISSPLGSLVKSNASNAK
ncbi:LOW QUALITY PROTEIN: solute carrier family 2, facilitated glucose transporter member 8-like [Dermacentor silvarum]|uniref:LOW QUALITY PROTEIN: solute carrier family 2, facilitated glucose transporter member 8-like n=1 Tax=Dermacentor silvarum TaxID=543639 RepID=UPI0021012ED5|nr:LOW QUALITY PROTEIN: solute carrier family 2, facilitated glucose transporter member 8-like [Dermacentor silvarum]